LYVPPSIHGIEFFFVHGIDADARLPSFNCRSPRRRFSTAVANARGRRRLRHLRRWYLERSARRPVALAVGAATARRLSDSLPFVIGAAAAARPVHLSLAVGTALAAKFTFAVALKPRNPHALSNRDAVPPTAPLALGEPLSLVNFAVGAAAAAWRLSDSLPFVIGAAAAARPVHLSLAVGTALAAEFTFVVALKPRNPHALSNRDAVPPTAPLAHGEPLSLVNFDGIPHSKCLGHAHNVAFAYFDANRFADVDFGGFAFAHADP